jgi:hypothetical protein
MTEELNIPGHKLSISIKNQHVQLIIDAKGPHTHFLKINMELRDLIRIKESLDKMLISLI